MYENVLEFMNAHVESSQNDYQSGAHDELYDLMFQELGQLLLSSPAVGSLQNTGDVYVCNKNHCLNPHMELLALSSPM
jgi:hypothetical protein